jgi:hypothetical protein
MSSSSSSSVDRVVASGIVPKSREESLFLLLHSLLLEKEFICAYEDGNSVPGFAAPIKDLAKGCFLPNKWEYAKTKLMYKHSERKGTLLFMKIESSNEGKVEISLRDNSGLGSSFVIPFDEYYVPEESIPKCYKNVDSLDVLITSLLSEIFPTFNKPSSHDIPNQYKTLFENNNSAQQNIENTDKFFANEVPMLHRTNPPPVTIAPSIGERDLNPFPENNIFRNPYPSIDTNYQGNLIGPDHPYFFPQNTDPFAGQGSEIGPGHPYFYPPNSNPFPDSTLPQPRFDPFGPVVGPNGPDFGNNGMIGRGRGRGRGNIIPRTFPGEPNPDHFRPPSNGFI